MADPAEVTIMDLGFTSNGKRLYHVNVKSDESGAEATETIHVPCMQILAIVPSMAGSATVEIDGSDLELGNIGNDETHNILVIAA